MRNNRLLILCLIALALFAWVAPATADNDDEPTVATNPATEITHSSARLNASVDPNEEWTVYRFQFGTTAAYGSYTPIASAGGGDDPVPVSAVVQGLAPNTTYHFRIVATNEEGTSRGSNRTFTTSAAPAGGSPPPGSGGGGNSDPAPEPEPVAPQSAAKVGVAPQSGSVSIRLPGTSEFLPLAGGSELPYGSEVDTREGSVNLTSTLPSGKAQTGVFGAGRFVVRRGRRGYVDLHLRGRACPADDRRPGQVAAMAVAAGRSGRKLWGRDNGGRFRTHGRNSHATVRGTRWSVADSCAGTLTRVSEGAVLVRDLHTGERRLLKAGQRYLARPRR